MGGAKPNTVLGGVTLLARAVATVTKAGLVPWVVAKPATELPRVAAEIRREPPGMPAHPLSGVVTALAGAEGEPVVVCGCDTPFVPATLLTRLGGAIVERSSDGSDTGLSAGQAVPGATWPQVVPGATPQPTVVAVSEGGRIHPLIAAWSGGSLELLRQALAAERSVTAAVEALEPELIAGTELSRYGDPRRICFNVNSPAELAEAESMLR